MQIWKDIASAWQQLDAQQSAQIPQWQQLLQMTLLYLFRHIGPGYFLQGRWWRPEISFRDKWLHVNKPEYIQFIDRWNRAAYRKASQHKLVEKAVLQTMSIPTPQFIGYLHPHNGACQNGDALCKQTDFEALCRKLLGHTICVKPVEGYGGSGFNAFKLLEQNGELLLEHPFTAKQQSLESWWQQAMPNDKGYILEHYLVQHPQMSALHPQSVNTIRIWVYLTPNGPQTAGAYLRVGQHGSMVDNISFGGIYCPVDLSNGQIKYGIDADNPTQVMLHHPNTNANLQQFQIPYWTECQQIAGRALRAFPEARIAGVDVAICADGPRMIELNLSPDQIGCAWMDLPLKKIDHQLRQAYGVR